MQEITPRVVGKDGKFGKSGAWVKRLSKAPGTGFRKRAAALSACLALGAGLVQATNIPTHAASAPVIERVDLLTSSAATGDAGNSWGGHKTRIVSTSKGDSWTVYQGAGSGYTAHQWVLMHYSAASGSWSQAASGNAGREPANILRGPDDTIYVIAWPGGLPALWSSADNFASQQNIPGSWLQNDWPYAGAGIDSTGNIYLVQTNSNNMKPGNIYYSVRNASTGQWSPVETSNTDLRSTYSFVLPSGNGLDFLASADVQWSTMGWTAPSNAQNSSYVWPETNLFHAAAASQAASETTIHSESQTSQYPNVNVYTQDAYRDNQGRIHILYQLTGPSDQDQFSVHHAIVQNGQVLKDVPLNMYDLYDARITQDSTGQFYFITTDNTCVCLLVYPADSVDGTTLQGSYASLPVNGYHPKDWLFLSSPRTGSALSDEIDFAFPADNAEQWVAGRLRLRDSGAVTPTPSVSATATVPATATTTAATAPAAPASLAGGFSNGGMSLSWNASAGASSYNVYRGWTSGNETLYQSGVASPSFFDTHLQAGIDYWYKVTAVNAAGESSASNEIITYTPSTFTQASPTPSPTAPSAASPTAPASGPVSGAMPPAPSGLSGSYSSGGMSLSWNASSGATSYNVYRGLNQGGESLYKTAVSGTSFRDTSNLQAGTDYWYKVTALNGTAQSGGSNEVITYMPPSAPSGLKGSFSSGANELSWHGGSNGTSYNLYRGWLPGQETLYKTGISGASYTDSNNLQAGKDYWYKVTAVNSSGESGSSNDVITYVN